MEQTQHFRDMLEERAVQLSWVEQTIVSPQVVENHEDGTRHFLRQIEECGNRWLRVVVTIKTNPNKMVTVFFDRRFTR